MNPLSGLQRLVVPQVQQSMMAKPEGVTGVPKNISLGELQQLSPQALSLPPSVGGSQGGSFGHVLSQLIQEASSKQSAAGDTVNGLLTGQNVSLHQAMIAMEEASVSFQLMVEVRNKLLESYQELMRMQI